MSEGFNPAMLALARQSRGLSQREVLDRLPMPVSQAKYSKIEGGLVRPDRALIEGLADVLRYRRSFFSNPTSRATPVVSFHRKRQKLSPRQLDMIHARAEIFRLNVGRLLASIEIEPRLPSPPAIDPDEYDGRVDAIARSVRQQWALPRGPVRDVTRILEDAGVVVVPFDFGSPLIDGFSQHATSDLPAFVFINVCQPKDRLRFSLAHELGHLVMHRLPRPDMETQANQFASEFLVPCAEVSAQFYNLSLQKFMEMKLYWNVSMQTLIYKAWQIGKISDRAFRYYRQQMSQRGFLIKEPIELMRVEERPTTLWQLVNAHLDDLSYSPDDLAEMFGLLTDEFGELYGAAAPKPRLKLVVSN